MEKPNLIQVEGKVIEVFPGMNFLVKLIDTEYQLIAYVSGRMKRSNIKVIRGDKVTVEISPSALLEKKALSHRHNRGRIVYRAKGRGV